MKRAAGFIAVVAPRPKGDDADNERPAYSLRAVHPATKGKAVKLSGSSIR